MTLPVYQRDISWTLHKCVELFNYQLLSKLPISAIYINIINNTSSEFAVPQVSLIDRTLLPEILRGEMSVVDGQQRLTTNYKVYCNHQDFKNVVIDLEKGKFIINEKHYNKKEVPVGILVNKDDKKLIEYTKNNRDLSSTGIGNALLQIE